MLSSKDKTNIMNVCCKIAKYGLGLTSPNPIVGAALVDPKGEIVAKGHHKIYGGNHAEINAINDAKANGIEDFSDLALFVTLEPCNHFGKTPPCTEEIIKAGIKNVYIGIKDPNPLVSGKGIVRLKEAGINVKIGIAKKECTNLIADYINYILKGMPYITLKVAQSLDGFIASKQNENKYLTSLESRMEVHRMRSYCAVLVGINTILVDDPILDNRLMVDNNSYNSNIKKNALLKTIILDTNLRTPPTSKVFSVKENRQIFIAYSADLDIDVPDVKARKEALEKQGAILIKSDIKNGEIHLRKLLSLLSVEYNIMHIMVEGGGKVFSSFVNSRLLNRLIVYTAPMLIGDGIKAFPNADKNTLNDILNTSGKLCYLSGKDMVNIFYRDMKIETENI